jgi:hypothetical protein
LIVGVGGECSGSEYFLCDNGACVPRVERCDEHDDCGDATDEENCCKQHAQASRSVCDNKTLVTQPKFSHDANFLKKCYM